MSIPPEDTPSSPKHNPTLALVLGDDFPEAMNTYFPPDRNYELRERWPFFQLGLLERRRNVQYAEQTHTRIQRLFMPGMAEYAEEDVSDNFTVYEWSDEGDDELPSDEESGPEKGVGYEPSEGSESEYGTDFENERDWDEEGITDDEDANIDISDSEISDIKHDGESGWPLHIAEQGIPERPEGEGRFIADAQFQLDNLDLDFEMAVCQGQYNPDEVIRLVSSFYELMIEMAHGEWKPGCISYAPHINPPINLELAHELGYSESALYIIQRLPYIKDRDLNKRESRVIHGTRFMVYTDDEDLIVGKHSPRGPNSYFGFLDIDPWLVPLAYPDLNSGDGYVIMLDTKIGAIKAWDHDMGPSFGTPEYARTRSLGYKCSTYEGPGDEQHLHRFARHVPASIYLQNMIRAYSELYRVPNMDPQHAYSYILSKDYGSNREENEFYHEIQDQRRTIPAMYRDCGWPDSFRREDFVRKLREYKAQLMDQE